MIVRHRSFTATSTYPLSHTNEYIFYTAYKTNTDYIDPIYESSQDNQLTNTNTKLSYRVNSLYYI